MKALSIVLAACIILFNNVTGYSQQTNEEFTISLKYLLALPQGYEEDTVKKWPLLIFLHGSGESGDDLSKVKMHGPPKLIEQGKKYPFIVVSPQAPPNTGWQTEILQRFLTRLKKQYRVDTDRVYLTGLSMGGYGTWSWSMKYPKEFAAIAPICGGGDPSTAEKLKNLPIWCFHGGKDDVVKPAESKIMVEAAKKHNPNVRLTIYPEAGHDSWTEAYNNDSLYTWLLSQKKFYYKPIAIAESKLKEFEGIYSRTGSDSLKIVMENGKLIAKTGHPDFELTPTGNDRFFLAIDKDQLEIVFSRNKKGKIEKFTFFEDKAIDFKKL